MNFPFERGPADGMILVAILLDGHTKMTVMLDTGASVSTFDSTELIVSGYDLKDGIGVVDIETANGQ
jgi:predicted aspartyl protease